MRNVRGWLSSHSARESNGFFRWEIESSKNGQSVVALQRRLRPLTAPGSAGGGAHRPRSVGMLSWEVVEGAREASRDERSASQLPSSRSPPRPWRPQPQPQHRRARQCEPQCATCLCCSAAAAAPPRAAGIAHHSPCCRPPLPSDPPSPPATVAATVGSHPQNCGARGLHTPAKRSAFERCIRDRETAQVLASKETGRERRL